MRIGLRAPVAALLAVLALPSAASAIQHDPRALPDDDSRGGVRLPAFSGAERAAQAELRGEIGQAAGGGRLVAGRGGVSVTGTADAVSPPRGGTAESIARGWLRGHASAFGLAESDVDALRLDGSSYTSWEGTTHLTFVQSAAGIRSYDNRVLVHVAENGSIVSAGSTALPDFGSGLDATPGLSPTAALGVAAREVGAPGAPPAVTQRSGGADRRTTFADGAGARLTWFGEPGGARLAWAVNVAGTDPDAYQVVVDATDGDVLARTNNTKYANSASVYDLRPLIGVSGQPHTVDLAPYLTQTNGTQGLKGLNVWAWSDTTDDCSVDLSAYPTITLRPGCAGPADANEFVGPSTGTNFVYPFTQFTPTPGCAPYPCAWDPDTATSWTTNRRQTATQAFWYANRFHDHLEAPPIGFDNPSRNFEGADPVIVNSDDSAVTPGHTAQNRSNNANFTFGHDGTSGVMQLYLFKPPYRAISSGDDALIVYHEYTHGLSGRLIGNAEGLREFQAGAMGEAWSDWYAFDAAVGDGLLSDTALVGQLDLDDYPSPGGSHLLRSQPIDCPVGASAAQCPGLGTAGTGGYTLGDLGRIADQTNVHMNGEIWAETLWDVRTAVGADVAERIVTDAMRNSPTLTPTFLDGRDAVLAADRAAFGGAHSEALWTVFARRGMGWKAAVEGGASTSTREDFSVPAALEADAAFTDPAPGGDGDGYAEPGETLRVTATVRNTGAATFNDGTVGITSSLATADDTRAVLPDVFAPGAVATLPYTVTIPSSVGCGADIPLTLAVASRQGPRELTTSIAAGGPPSVSSAVIPIPDGPASGASSPLVFPTAATVDDVTVTVNITHQWMDDLTVSLISPAGTKVVLSKEHGGNKAGYKQTVFEDDAVKRIDEGSYPFTGRFRPEGSLAALRGQPADGTWTLKVVDPYTGASGTVDSWSLEAGGENCSTSASPPVASTGGAVDVSSGGARLTGSVDPRGVATGYRFAYGPTVAYGNRTDAGDAGAGSSGAVGVATSVTGLSAGATYHYRIEALRDGAVVARGEDTTFVAADPPAVQGPPGSGGGGGGGDVTPPPPPKAGFSFRSTPKTLTVDAKGQFTFTFGARTGLAGTASFTAAKKVLKLGRKSFKSDARGAVKVKFRLSKADLKKLKKKKSAKVTATVIATGTGEKATRTFTLKAPKKRRKNGV